MNYIKYILIAFLFPLCIIAQEVEPADSTAKDSAEAALPTDVYGSLVVVTPGSTPGSILGHVAIRMYCPSAHLDYCFTTKAPDLGNELTAIAFRTVRAGLVPEETETFRNDYRSEGRGIKEYDLNLSLPELRQLWQYLDEDVSRGPFRTMDYVHDGCAHQASANILAAIGDRSEDVGRAADRYINGDTRRDIVRRYSDGTTWESFLLHTFFAGAVDEKVSGVDRIIMPEDMVAVYSAAGLIGPEHKVCSASLMTSSPTFFSPLVCSILFFLLCLVRKKVIDYPVMAFQFIVGSIMCYMVFVSPSPGTEWNWLIIAFNPVMPVLHWCRNRYVHYVVAVLLIALCVYIAASLQSTFFLPQLFFVMGILVRKPGLTFRIQITRNKQ